MHMYISVVTLFVDDVDRTVAFYTEKLGWEKTADMPMGDGMRWVTVAPKGSQTMFSLSLGFPNQPKRVGGFSGVVLEVDDVYKTAEELEKRGVELPEKPRTEPWGGWATFQDSEGNIHGLHSPAAAGANKH
jgi:predicted enzyme related to lactoylglutathione lyase